MVVVRLPGIGGQELASLVDLVADSGDMVVVAARPKEAHELLAGSVLGEDACHMSLELNLGEERLRQIQEPVKP